MRLTAYVLVCGFVLVGAIFDSAVAEADSITVQAGLLGGSIGYSAGGGSPGSGVVTGGAPGAAVAPPAHGGAHTASAKAAGSGPFYASTPALADNGTGGFCITFLPQAAASAAAASAVTNSYNGVVSNLHGQSYSSCQRATQAAGVPVGAAAPPPPPPPSAVAASYWSTHGQDLLAVPKPYIAPGYALTGLPGYLQTGAPVAQHFGGSTPLGALSITAHGTFVVDWGDGQSATFTIPGGPYPTGTITHTWDMVGTYEVSVTEDWTATWSLGGQQGTLGALHTRGAIPAFQARQLESVRNR